MTPATPTTRRCPHTRQRVTVQPNGTRVRRCLICGQTIGKPLATGRPVGGGAIESLGRQPRKTASQLTLAKP